MIHMLGVSENDSDLFVKWIYEMLELGVKNDAILMNAFQEMAVQFRRAISRSAKTAARHRLTDLLAVARCKGS